MWRAYMLKYVSRSAGNMLIDLVMAKRAFKNESLLDKSFSGNEI